MATNNAINNSTKVTTFIASGTWTKDTRTKFVHVYIWNGGSGGGGGRQGASGTAGGGSGGGSGPSLVYFAPGSYFDTSETVTIGAGGGGGGVQASTNSNGNNGNPGNQTSI